MFPQEARTQLKKKKFRLNQNWSLVLVGIALVSRFTPIYGACCSAQMLHEPVKQSRQLVLRAY